MNKIPVLETIRAAYGFVFEHLGAIIGLIWVPQVISTVLSFFVQDRYYTALNDAVAAQNVASAGPAMLAILFSGLAAMLLYTMMIVPVMQLALGTRQGGALVHVAFGAAEWRLFRAVLGFALLLVVPVSLIFALLGLVQQPVGGPQMAVGGMLGILLLEGAAIFLALRFGFLLPAAAVVEEGNVLARSWLLSAGNFWRIFAILICVLGPLLVLTGVAEVALVGPSAVIPMPVTPAAAAVQMSLMREKMPLLMGLGFLMAPFFLGLSLGAGAAAWRSLAKGSPANVAGSI
jgi:hypothetical protein